MSGDGSMTCWERIEATVAGEQVDRTPLLGGWICCAETICELAGATGDEYREDPEAVNLRAYRSLGSDAALIGYMAPQLDADFRIVTKDSYARADRGKTLEECVAEIDAMPDPADIEKDFDFDEFYAQTAAGLKAMAARCDPMVYMPAQWAIGSQAGWYGNFGYENYCLMTITHPERMIKMFRIGGANGSNRARVMAKLIEDGLYPHTMLIGEDITTQRGSLVHPDFLWEHFLPTFQRGLQPLVDVGCKCVFHCDGDVRELLPMFFAAGVAGLQGFQPECGMDIDTVAKMRTKDGDPLVIYGPLSVTTELPVCTPDEIRAKVRHAISVCADQGARLILFTANTINPDVPPANIRAMHEAARE